jgi:hypothetical protein
MKVVGHQHIRVHSNRFLRGHRGQMIQEKLAIIILEKHRSPVDPAQDQVHWIAGGDDTCASRHGSQDLKDNSTEPSPAEKHGISLFSLCFLCFSLFSQSIRDLVDARQACLQRRAGIRGWRGAGWALGQTPDAIRLRRIAGRGCHALSADCEYEQTQDSGNG